METINSATSLCSRTNFCSVSPRIFCQKYALQYRCWRPLGCRKILTQDFTAASWEITLAREFLRRCRNGSCRRHWVSQSRFSKHILNRLANLWRGVQHADASANCATRPGPTRPGSCQTHSRLPRNIQGARPWNTVEPSRYIDLQVY
jgi:hypothetical protein